MWMLIAILWIGIGVIAGGNTVLNPYVPTQILAVPAATSQMTMFPSYGTEWSELDRLKSGGEMIQVQIREGYDLYIPTDATAEGRERSAAKALTMVDKYIERETTARRSQAIPTVLGWVFLPPIILLITGWAIGWAISG